MARADETRIQRRLCLGPITTTTFMQAFDKAETIPPLSYPPSKLAKLFFFRKEKIIFQASKYPWAPVAAEWDLLQRREPKSLEPKIQFALALPYGRKGRIYSRQVYQTAHHIKGWVEITARSEGRVTKRIEVPSATSLFHS